ncbi:hypothetical protein DFJ73DRAFT_772777 [Zopfochytrium polystomum]|nr:hypothetical protein DFJ73DRAFT_772777 [Zopfochytrium polystomum]
MLLIAATLLSLTVSSALAQLNPSVIPVGSLGSYTRTQSCIFDHDVRVLPYYQGDGFDNDGCVQKCWDAGHLISGTEYGGQCYCGDPHNEAVVPTVPGAPTPQCNMACSSNPSQICGGVYALTRTILTPVWTYWGCLADSDSRVFPISAGNVVIPAACQNICFEQHNARFAGIEYGGQCYCAVSLPGGQVFPGSTCDMACSGDSSKNCGGTWALSAYYIL